MLIGVDMVEIRRIEDLAKNPAFLKRIYTEEEISLVQDVSNGRRAEILAGRFAVKEAVAKALGTGISGGLTFRDIQTLQGSMGEPVLSLQGKAKEMADCAGVSNLKVSLSHAAGLVIAFVLLETGQAE
ncbi:holo-ACP synthase [Effusibacillus lacus]|uniref:Holo-[acyl-carrier-protein] synthase n=1 Tax=Effusibacillus lacus TaxID=1348429 RepID=A0A292YPC6_9BACL|nr:holo-ACP synthase [Effusibacillus lacus]TCS70625.1 holo-[acyl-carrier-protein] synthase [Effusibacillus lacus]GAX90623.1 holo-[acyl-carrier-protein] synthase [Effusibacillus lacus]